MVILMDTFADSSQSRPVIALMTDFGIGDGDVGVMKGVIAGIAPAAHMIDITHEIAPQQVLSGAWILSTAYRYFPRETIFLCVVDPGVGSERRAIAVHAGDWFFVGPDNGLFTYVYAEQTVHMAVTLTNPQYHLSQVSSTFHGRDIFAPAAAYLARGVSLTAFSPAVDVAMLERLDLPQAVRQDSVIAASVVQIDRFGNCITNIPLDMVPELFDPRVQARAIFGGTEAIVDQRGRFFAGGPAGIPFLYGDSVGCVGVAVRNGNAAATLGVRAGARVTLMLASN